LILMLLHTFPSLFLLHYIMHLQRARREEVERELSELQRAYDQLEQRLSAGGTVAKADLIRLESELRAAGEQLSHITHHRTLRN
jgi:hypothetical protein